MNTLTDEETALSPQMLNTMPKNSQPVSEQDGSEPKLNSKEHTLPSCSSLSEGELLCSRNINL